MIKVIVLLKRNQNLTREEFKRHWRDVHGPLVMTVPELTRHMRKYVQNHLITEEDGRGKSPLKQPDSATDFDGIVEIWYESYADMPNSFKNQPYKDIIAPDEKRLLDIEQCVMFVTEEVMMFDENNRPPAEKKLA